ncbi:hypothetical protein EAY64_19700 [Aquitalea palustris]|uniref:Uncharacterized protein n=1 Tax=Aquitalea palustris TaxID=2480983 RepID=A0A454JD25_9NEIS|nr:hypothetical protein [Aquitalea palustris]RMC91079.1 hypothetical protein EAY64_19700 [Aquitalea palustris]
MHTVKPRNPYACSPLLKKGGAHRNSRSGLRQNARQAMLAELDELDWIDQYPAAQAVEPNSEDDAPGSFSRPLPMTKAASQRPLPCYARPCA